jgi:hypothetical protein
MTIPKARASQATPSWADAEPILPAAPVYVDDRLVCGTADFPGHDL